MQFFREVVLPYEGTACLIWPFAKDADGYAKLRVDGALHYVCRLICTGVHGEPPTPRHEAAHFCGRGDHGCVTKRHLDWKTPKENKADMLLHGTRLRGEKCASAKVTVDQVIEARAAVETQQKIADRLGISRGQVSRIRNKQDWKHVA
jgi:hypothetical protein